MNWQTTIFHHIKQMADTFSQAEVQDAQAPSADDVTAAASIDDNGEQPQQQDVAKHTPLLRDDSQTGAGSHSYRQSDDVGLRDAGTSTINESDYDLPTISKQDKAYVVHYGNQPTVCGLAAAAVDTAPTAATAGSSLDANRLDSDLCQLNNHTSPSACQPKPGVRLRHVNGMTEGVHR